MNITQWIMFIINLIPQILALILQVEGELGAGAGKAKQQAVIDAISIEVAGAGATPTQLKQVQKMTAAVTTDFVKTLNSTGAFKTTPPPDQASKRPLNRTR
jgi:hypothetical protein